jgi:hypothetical protein
MLDNPVYNATFGSDWYHACALYRYFDAAGDLLYIGISKQPSVRHDAHTKRGWMPHVAYRKMEWFPHPEFAEWAETIAIEAESPLENLKPGRAYDPPRRLAPWFLPMVDHKPVGMFHEWHALRLYARSEFGFHWACLDQCAAPYWHPADGATMTPGPQTVVFRSIRAAA